MKRIVTRSLSTLTYCNGDGTHSTVDLWGKELDFFSCRCVKYDIH